MTENETTKVVPTATVFYSVLILASILWGWVADLPVLWIDHPPSASTIGLHLAMGLGLGLLIVVVSRLSTRWSTWGKELTSTMQRLLGPLSWSDAFWLALLSATGEEMLFRGAMHPTLGLLPTAALFMLAHFPQQKSWIPWTIMTGVLGLGFGAIVEETGQLIIPWVAHFVVNFLNLKMISDWSPSD